MGQIKLENKARQDYLWEVFFGFGNLGEVGREKGWWVLGVGSWRRVLKLCRRAPLRFLAFGFVADQHQSTERGRAGLR